MQREDLLDPVSIIIESCRALLAGAGEPLTIAQERIALSILQAAETMRDLLVSLPDLSIGNARLLLSYESRSLLASIIGYAEALLDQADGPLTAAQVDQARLIRERGRLALALLLRLLAEANSGE